jgi:signal transduction histidine kinase
MFKKLRQKVTLITVAVIIILFTLFSAALYIQMRYNYDMGTKYGLQRITDEVIIKKLADFPEPAVRNGGEGEPKSLFYGIMPQPPRPNFFFIKVRGAGEEIYASRGTTVNESDLLLLINATLQENTLEGTTTLDGARFAFLKTPLPDGGDLIVYNDLRNIDENLSTLARHLIGTVAASAFLACIVVFWLSKYAIRPIEISVEQQKNFVSDASHELRTPITIIQTNLDIINGAAPKETVAENRKWIDNIQSETSRMAELINTLLFLARADANQQLLEKEYFELQPVIADAMEAFLLIAERKNVELNFAVSEGIVALGDAVRLKQVLTILLDNAIRHTPSGGTVTAAAHDDKANLTITIADTGEGMAKKHLTKIFNRFYQIDESRHNGGSGLGLSLAKWIVEKHGGTIYAESELGKGSTFTIKLPKEKPAESD